MRCRVTVTVDVHASSLKEAEREAMKAIVSDLVGWSNGIIDIRTEIVEAPQRRPQSKEVVEGRASKR
jgi:hypothetical protein